ncbi:hypothetical protein N9A55_07305 [Luminiphilus sp.]|nr:hypothetical protein [Luminiphilus sp.]
MLLATKLLSLLVYPLSLGLLLLLVAVISGAIGRRGLSWLMTLLAFLVIYFPATEFGSEALMQPLEGRHPAFSPEELPAADAIVLLGGGRVTVRRALVAVPTSTMRPIALCLRRNCILRVRRPLF